MLRITALQLCLLVAGMLTGIAVGQLMAAVGKDNTVLISVCIGLANLVYVFVFLREDSAGGPGGAEDRPSNLGGPSRIYEEDRARLVAGTGTSHPQFNQLGQLSDSQPIPEGRRSFVHSQCKLFFDDFIPV